MTIKKNNSARKDKTQFVFIISIILFLLEGVVNAKTINLPDLFYWLMFLALIFCCYKERKLFKDIKHFAIGHFLVQYFVLFLLFVGGGMTVFGGINALISKENAVESNYFEIIEVADNTSVTSNFITVSIEDEEVSVPYNSSSLIFNLVHNPSLCDKYFLYLEYRKGILGTYIVSDKNIVRSWVK
jgi:predicted membrane protein